jgi:hypothetical protein
MTFVFAIVLFIAAAILTAVITPHPSAQDQQPSNLSDFQLPTTAEGTPQAITFGDVWSEDWTVLWYGDLGVETIHSGGGGKK